MGAQVREKGYLGFDRWIRKPVEWIDSVRVLARGRNLDNGRRVEIRAGARPQGSLRLGQIPGPEVPIEGEARIRSGVSFEGSWTGCARIFSLSVDGGEHRSKLIVQRLVFLPSVVKVQQDWPASLAVSCVDDDRSFVSKLIGGSPLRHVSLVGVHEDGVSDVRVPRSRMSPVEPSRGSVLVESGDGGGATRPVPRKESVIVGRSQGAFYRRKPLRGSVVAEPIILEPSAIKSMIAKPPPSVCKSVVLLCPMSSSVWR